MVAAPLQTLAGSSTTLGNFAGQPTVVNLWATWCPPCRREMPLLFSTAEVTSEVNMLLVNQGEGAGTVARYLEETLNLKHGTAAHVLLDPRGEVGDTFRASGIPTTLFFNAQGVLVHRHVGELSRAELLRRVESLLK